MRKLILLLGCAGVAVLTTLRLRRKFDLPRYHTPASASSSVHERRRLELLRSSHRFPASTLLGWGVSEHHLYSERQPESSSHERRRLFGWGSRAGANDPRTVDQKDVQVMQPQSIPSAYDDPRTISAPLRICERMAPISLDVEQQVMAKITAECPITNNRPPEDATFLILEGINTFGRTGNNLIEFLHALQLAKDQGMIVGIMQGSWPMHLITEMWMAIHGTDAESRHSPERAVAMGNWIHFVERAFCIKVIVLGEELLKYRDLMDPSWFMSVEDLGKHKVVRMDTRDLLVFQHNYHDGTFEEYVEFQSWIIRTLYRYHNRGMGVNLRNKRVQDMCSVLDAMFGGEKYSATYSVIHSRSLEGDPGIRLLGRIAQNSGCDPTAALDMEPEYIKAILKPLGMLEHPILFITDHQRPEILEKLKADPEIGPNIRLIPDEVSWVGGDITVAMMANVFIGNPASTFSGFIAKSRVALGYDTNFMFRKKEEDGRWVDVCDHRCIFSKKVMNAMA